MGKALIMEIGIVDVDNKPKFWMMRGGGLEIEAGGDSLGGYSIEELKQIARARNILSNLGLILEGMTINIPPGRYSIGIFSKKFQEPLYTRTENIVEPAGPEPV